MAENIRTLAAKTSVNHAKQTIAYTVSIGVAPLDSKKPADLQTLMKQADKALYEAKKLGKNRTFHYQ